jgi:ribosomal-protein-alanine N-acetyltransferase
LLALPKLEVRQVRDDDLEQVVALEDASFDDPYPAYFLKELVEDNRDTFLVAVSEGKVLGYAVVDRWVDHDHLVSIAVYPAVRGRGMGQLLFSGLEERLVGKRALRLEVRRSNTVAIRFYKKNGVKEVGVEPGYYRDGEDALLMEKNG